MSDELRRRAVDLAVIAVAVPPQHELLEHEEQEDARRAPRRTRGAAASPERLGQQRQQRHPEHRADGVAHEPRHELDPDAVAKQQERRREQQPAEAAEQAQTNGDEER